MNEKVFRFEITATDTSDTLKKRIEIFCHKLFFSLPIGQWECEIRKPKRSTAQNRALHLFFTQISAELNGVGAKCESISILDQRVISEDWDAQLVKDRIWRPVQRAKTGKESTTNLQTNELDIIAEPIIKLLAQKFGFGLLFPSHYSRLLEEESAKINFTKNDRK